MSVLPVLVPILLQYSSRSILPDPLWSLHSVIVRLGQDLIQPMKTASRAEFWFFRDSNLEPHFEGLLEVLIRSEPFSTHPKRLIGIGSELDGRNAGVPALAIVFLGSGDMRILKQIGGIHVHTRLVVVFTFHSMNHVLSLLRKFVGVRLLNVLYLTIYEGTYQYDMFNYYVFRDEIQVRNEYESVEQVFPELTEFEGQTVDACTHYGASYSETNEANKYPKGLDVHLVRIITKRMNGTLNIKFIECGSNEKVDDCNNRRLDNSDCLFNFGHWQLYDAEYGIPIMPFYSQVIIVPRGEPFNIYELMVAPFTQPLWHFITCTLLLILCLNLFLKDWISEHVYDIIRNKTINNLMLVGISMLTFVTLSGYEAKIVAFLADWPNRPDVTRVEQLQSSGINIISQTMLAREQLSRHSGLVGILQIVSPFSNFSFSNLPPKTGVMVEYGASRRMYNYISKTNQKRYMILDERFKTTMLFYYFGYRNFMMKHFSTVLNRLHESGIDQHWKNIEDFSPELISEINSTNGMITYKELEQLFPVIKNLWMLSIIVLLLEMMYSMLKKILIKIRHRKIAPMPRKRAQTYPLGCIRRHRIARNSF